MQEILTKTQLRKYTPYFFKRRRSIVGPKWIQQLPHRKHISHLKTEATHTQTNIDTRVKKFRISRHYRQMGKTWQIHQSEQEYGKKTHRIQQRMGGHQKTLKPAYRHWQRTNHTCETNTFGISLLPTRKPKTIGASNKVISEIQNIASPRTTKSRRERNTSLHDPTNAIYNR